MSSSLHSPLTTMHLQRTPHQQRRSSEHSTTAYATACQLLQAAKASSAQAANQQRSALAVLPGGQCGDGASASAASAAAAAIMPSSIRDGAVAGVDRIDWSALRVKAAELGGRVAFDQPCAGAGIRRPRAASASRFHRSPLYGTR